MKRTLRLLLLAASGAGLPGSTCDGNLGDVSTGPVSFRVSVAKNFSPADGPSLRASSNFDGNFVAFETAALNIAGTEPGFKEILIRDRANQTVISASRLKAVLDQSGRADCEEAAMSADGDWVAFTSRGDLLGDTPAAGPEAFKTVWRYNRTSDLVGSIVPTLPSFPFTPVDGDCMTPSLSANGGVLAFSSFATNIDTNPAVTVGGGDALVYVVDTVSLTPGTRLISHAAGDPTTPCNNDAINPVVSADGQWIVFMSRATNLVAGVTDSIMKIYRASLDGSVIELVSRMDGVAGAPADDHCASPSVSADGSMIAFAFQGGNLAPAPLSGSLTFPLMLRDLRVPGAPTTRVIAPDIFLFGIFNPVLVGDRSVMSADGSRVAYTAVVGDLQDLQIKVVDTATGAQVAVSKGVIEPGITELETLFSFPTISGDGAWVYWHSAFSREVIGDTNALTDIFGYGSLR